jgi:hypothetical protein
VTSNNPNNQPPTVAINSPASGANVALGNAVTIAATASDSDGAVAQVAFFANGAQIAGCVDAAAPYECSWTPTTPGVHSLTAQALDNAGATTISAIVAVTANDAGNQLPTVSISSPANGATVQVGQTVVIAATAADPDGTVAQVTFFANGVAIFNCVDSTAPYACVWQPTVQTTYNLTALVTDTKGGTTLSAPVSVTSIVSNNQPPTASISSPTNGATFLVGATVPIKANASDADGSVTKVTFFANGVAIDGCDDTAAPYECNFTATTAGTLNLTALATDNIGIATLSGAIAVTINNAGNPPPTVVISSPANGANFVVGNPVTIAATASDSNGTVAQVEFFANGNLIAGCVDTTAPYECTWTPNTVDAYNLTAQATDNGGATTISAIVVVTANNSNNPPPITVTSPTNGATVQVGKPVLITVAVTASASSVDANLASIVQVAFFANGAPIAGCVDTAAPFQCTWTPTTAGQYSLTALATDNVGGSSTALAVTVTAVDEQVPSQPQLYLPLINR